MTPLEILDAIGLPGFAGALAAGAIAVKLWQWSNRVFDPARFAKKHKQRLKGYEGTWEFSSLGFEHPGAPRMKLSVPLAEAFVPPRLYTEAQPDDDQAGAVLDLDDFLDRRKHLLVIGPAGYGKTTLSRQLLLQLRERPAALPIPLVLRDLLGRCPNRS